MKTKQPAATALGLIQLELVTDVERFGIDVDFRQDINGVYVYGQTLLGRELNDEYETEPACLDSLLEELPLEQWVDAEQAITTVYLLVKLTFQPNELNDPTLRYGGYYELDFVELVDLPYVLRQVERDIARYRLLPKLTIDK